MLTKFSFSKINLDNVAGVMYYYTPMLVYILSLLRCLMFFQWWEKKKKKPAWCASADTSSISLKLRTQTAGDTETKKASEMHKCIYMYTHTHTQKDRVKTRKFSAFTPQLSSSFREFTVFICWEFPDVLLQINKNPLSLCVSSSNTGDRKSVV